MKDTEELRAEKRKQTRPSTPDGVGDGVAASIDHKERHKTRTEQESETKDSKSRLAYSAIMQLVQQHERYGRIASTKRETKHDQAHLMALETVLLHPLITKSGTKQEQNKESETKDSKSRLAYSAIMQLVQQHEDTEELQAEKRNQARPSTPDGVGDGVAASIDHKERHKTRTEQRERDQRQQELISKQRNHATRATT